MTDSRLSVQLYSVRDAIAADLPSAIARIAEIGYTNVEPYGFVDLVDRYRAAFAVSGLSAPSGHASLVAADTETVFAAAAELGISTVIDPHVDAVRWTTRDDVVGVANDLNAVVPRASELGLAIGYHNHAFELENVIDGVTALEIFADALDPRVVLEVDTYWAAVGGQDVPALLRRLGDRVKFLHIKDGPISKDDTEQVGAGRGAMPVAEIIAAAPSDTVLVAELDDTSGQIFEELAASYAFFGEQGLR